MKIEVSKSFGERECPSCATPVPANSNRCPICGYVFPALTHRQRGLKIGASLLMIALLLALWLWL